MKLIVKLSKVFVLTVALFTLTSAYVLQQLTPLQAMWINYWVLSWYLITKGAKYYKIYRRHYNRKFKPNI